MECLKCKNINDRTSNYCFNCGSSLKNKNYETSLAMGAVCLASSFVVNILCFIPGIISIIFAKKYKKESGKLGAGFGMALGGMIYSFIIFMLIVLIFIIVFIFSYNINNEYTIDDSFKYVYKLK